MRCSKMFRRNKCSNTLLYFVELLIICNTFIKEIKSTDVIKGSLPDLNTLSRLFNMFLKPMINPLPDKESVYRTSADTDIDKVIRERTAELHPYLQDDDVKNLENKLYLDDNDETTIIEFLPKTEDKNNKTNKEDIFKSHLKKYKKIREKINKALIKESVSDKTKKLVVKTIDDLIRNLVGSQCKWKRNLRANGHDEAAVIADRWNQGLHKLRSIITNLFKDDIRRNDDVPIFLNNLQLLFTSVSKDFDIISKRYRIQCELIPRYRSHKLKHEENFENALRNNWDNDNEERCQDIVICSNELKEFMQSLYLAINDTSISVIRNYAEMYTRDVISDNENEKYTVISSLNKINDKTVNNIKHIFIKQTNNLTLDKEKNADANMNALSNYIQKTINDVKESIKSDLNYEIGTLGEKIQTIVRDDLNVNLNVDLGNLERELISKICRTFRICNGKYSGRRLLTSNPNKNSLFVQVQLTMDDNMKDIYNYRSVKDIKNAQSTTVIQMKEFANVTRTTHF